MKKLKEVFGMLLFLTIVLAIIYLLVFIFGSSLFTLLGMQYESLGTLLKFFAFYMFLSSFTDSISEITLKLMKISKIFNKKFYYFLYVIIDASLNIILLEILSKSMKGIQFSAIGMLLSALIISIFNVFLDEIIND